MNLFDIALLIAAVVSVIVGAVRGFVKEAAALAGWVLAVVLVMNASVSLGQRLPFEAGSIGVRTGIAAILIVLVCVLTAHLVGRLLRAAAVWLLVALVVIHVGLAERPFWRSSRLAPSLEAALRLISPDLAPSMHRPIVAQGV
jgi:uncharacterized membrane protein required for colicin V production